MAVYVFFYQLFMFLVYLPLFIFFYIKKRVELSSLAKRWNQRANKTDLLIHVASIGEFNGIKELIRVLKDERPELKITVSCITDSAYKLIKDFELVDQVVYLPVDFYFNYKRLFSKMRPTLVIITETEYWLAFLYFLSKERIPYIYINARLTAQNKRFYFLFKKLLEPNLRAAAAIYTSGEVQYNKLREIFDLGNIYRGNNFKYLDLARRVPLLQRDRYGLRESERVIIFGSIHRDELGVLHKSFMQILEQGHKLILAPRHLGDLDLILKLFSNQKLRLLSEWENKKDEWKVFVIDKFGVLRDFYGIGDIAVVCGSFDNTGGHNLVEPLVYGVPVFFGPNFKNFEEEGRIILKYYNAVLQADNLADELAMYDLSEIESKIDNILENLKPAEEFVEEVRNKIWSFL